MNRFEFELQAYLNALQSQTDERRGSNNHHDFAKAIAEKAGEWYSQRKTALGQREAQDW